MSNFNVEKIDNILNNFLKEFGASAQLSNEFQCQARKNKIIYYTLYVEEDEHGWFETSLSRIDPDIICDPFLSSFFHELGHIMTANNFTDDDWDNYFDDVYDIEDNIYEGITEEECKELNFRYFDLPMEKAATEWACKYMRENADKVAELWAELKPAIIECYFNFELSIDS